MPQRTIRFSETTLKQIRQAARKNGSTSTAIVRHAVEQALTGNEEAVERRIAATLDQIRGDLSRMQRVQQTLFAFVDTRGNLPDLDGEDQRQYVRREAQENGRPRLHDGVCQRRREIRVRA